MLRWLGLSLVFLGVLSALCVVGSVVGIFLAKQSIYWFETAGWACTFAFSLSGLAAGAILVRSQSAKQVSPFWIAALGAIVCLPLVVVQIASFVREFASGGDVPIWSLFFSQPPFTGWWPPKDSALLDLLSLRGLDVLPTIQIISGFTNSWFVWADLPFAICLWGVLGRSGLADRIVALIALLFAGWTAIFAIFTAIDHYQLATLHPPKGMMIDFLYYPKFSWYVLYATAVFWVVAIALLLSRRRAKS